MKLVDQRKEHDIRSVNRQYSWGHIRDPVYKKEPKGPVVYYLRGT